MVGIFLTSPHSGEEVPKEVEWLQNLEEKVLMCDVDRFVDRLYQPAIDKLRIDFIKARWHRYVVDLNRSKKDVDADSVHGSAHPSGTHPKGFHWSVTTQGQTLINEPLSQKTHESLYKKYYLPFHQSVEERFEKKSKEITGPEILHLDVHSMPSMGTSFHRDMGEKRSQIVISDKEGKSCKSEFKDIVIAAYKKVGFEVAYNWPYVGGYITEHYGNPQKGRHTLQVEMNRELYMDETTKKWDPAQGQKVQNLLTKALEIILYDLQ